MTSFFTDPFSFQTPAGMINHLLHFSTKSRVISTLKQIIFCGESSSHLTCRLSGFVHLFLRQPITFFLKSLLCLLASFTSFSLPKLKHADACTASSSTKCSPMLCHFSSHLPGLLFAYALGYLPRRPLCLESLNRVSCCVAFRFYYYYLFQASFASYSLPDFSLLYT